MASTSSNPMNVDKMLSYCGDFGNFQYILLALFSMINVLCAFHYFGQVFIARVPEFTCKLYPNETALDTNCKKMVIEHGKKIEVRCTEWKYKSSYGYVSLVQELNWVCDEDWKGQLGQSIFFLGCIVGTLTFGALADRIGRLPCLVMANICAFIGNFITIFVYNMYMYATARFIAGGAVIANFSLMYILVLEYTRPTMRTYALQLTIGIFYCIASMLLPWVVVLCRHWKKFVTIIVSAYLIPVLFYCCVQESAQWHISKGHFEKAMKCYTKIAKINRKIIPDNIVLGLKAYIDKNIDNNKARGNFIDLLKSRNMRRRTFILIFEDVLLTLCYDAIARHVDGLGYSSFVIFTATSATIFPGCLIILALQDRIGRKAMVSISMFIGAVLIVTAGIILAYYHPANKHLTLALIITSRLNIIVAYNSETQFAYELIPTQVRAQTAAVLDVAGFAGSFFSPQILYTTKYWRPLPEFIIGFLMMVGAFLCLFLPETLHQPLPITVHDGESFKGSKSMFTWRKWKHKKRSQRTQ